MNRNFIIKNVNVHSKNDFIMNGQVLIENGIVKEVSKQNIDLQYPTINGKGKFLLPGFIDIHANGGGGSMSIDGTYNSIENIVNAHAENGTTGILITTISVEDSQLQKSLDCISEVAKNQTMGSKILGIHLEGPFLNPEKRGAHQKQFLKKPNIDLFNSLNNASREKIRIVSLAPELENSFELIEYLKNNNIIIGLAHSEANYNLTKKAISQGLSLCTHLFNGMIPLSHKEAGPVGAFLTTSNTFVELISDGIHVSPPVLEIVYKTKGPNEIILVTDAVTPAGTNMKKFTILGMELEVRDLTCYIPNTQNLAGSALTLNKAVKIFKEQTSCSFVEAINMASLNPAILLGIENKKGSIEVGKDADLILVDDELTVFLTIIEGNVVFKNLESA